MEIKKPNFRSPIIESRYLRAIKRLLRGYMRLPKKPSTDELLHTLENWKKVDFIWSQTPELIAGRMMTMITKHDDIGWRKAASESSKGRLIHSLLKRQVYGPLRSSVNELITENARLIRTVPSETAIKLTSQITKMQLAGIRHESMVSVVNNQATHLLNWQAKRIARTEVSKATTAVTRVRSEMIGLNWYQWQSVDDARTRPAHRLMDNVLINWNDPPSPEMLDGLSGQGHYHAGNIYNCRCEALPVTSTDEIHWPAKVYVAGKILSLTKRQFELQFNQHLLSDYER